MRALWSPYFLVLRQQLNNSLAKLMTFRVNFLLTVLFDIASFVTFYFTADILFLNISHVGTWTREHFLFFIFWMQSINCVHSGFVAPNFWNLAMEIRTGSLDFRLLRPLGSLFDVFTAITRPISFLIMPVLVGVLVHYGLLLGFPTVSWIAMPFLWLISLVLLVLLEVLISMGLFWTHGGDGVNFIRIHCQQFQRWPDFVYPQPLRFIFSRLFPLLAAGVFPVRILFGQGSWWEIGFLLIAIVAVWLLIGRLWVLGVRRYESVAS
jgi:ABC-type uncharacterized transport system permease subunit